MNQQDHVTLGEVYRICQEIREGQKEDRSRLKAVENDLLRLKSYGAVAVIAGGLGIDWLKHKLGWG